MIAGGILGGVKQGDVSCSQMVAHVRHEFGGLIAPVKLLDVPCLELVEFSGVMGEPLAQVRGGRHLRFSPTVKIRTLLGNAARPHPIHQNTVTVGRLRGIIYAFDLKNMRLRHAIHARCPE